MKPSITITRSRLLLALAGMAALAVAGCASSTSIITGTRRAAVAADDVRLYTEPPSRSETIGLVRSHSLVGLGEQGHLDAALRELRAEAGRLGANGIILLKAADRPIALIGGGGKSRAIGVPIDTPHFEGRAIYVSNN